MIEAVFSNKKMYNAEMTVVMASRSSNYCLFNKLFQTWRGVVDILFQTMSTSHQFEKYAIHDQCFQGLVKIGIPLDSPTFYTVCEAEKAAFDEAENKREEEEAKDGPVDSDAEEGDDDDAADEADSDDADPKSETKEDVTAAAEENVKDEL
ncbi:calreticulin-2-like isoform X2 [Coffea eugenioides]|uniref:calreticulin-2-like isoform X2 n=1 Tax=Coffea eugenioides TaxID=49369 RepID=UPI000F610052|nr:calreticulin-2-like isoform X2 [Coffea eugenioides]